MAVRISRRAARSSRSLFRFTVTSTSGTAAPASRPTMSSVTTSSISVKPRKRGALTARSSLIHLQLVLGAGRRLERPSAGTDGGGDAEPVSYTHLRAHETPEHLVCRLLL